MPSEAEVPVVGTSDGTSSGFPVGNAWGSLTQTAGTAIVRLAMPRVGERTVITGFSYIAAATAHSLTFLTAQATGATAASAASGATTFTLAGPLAGFDGGILASGDYLVIEHADGTFGTYLASGLSGLVPTIGALTKNVDAGAKVWLMGAAGDHTDRRFSCPASVTTTLVSCLDAPIAVGTANYQPILAYSDNSTNAGTLFWAAWGYLHVESGQRI